MSSLVKQSHEVFGAESSMVVDLGSRVTRAGLVSAVFPDPNGPRICVPSSYGGGNGGAGDADIRYPITRGCIEDMDGVEAILKDVLGGMVHPRSVLVVEPSMQSRSTRESLMEVLFERFGVANYFAMDAAVASLYSIGKTSGIVVDVGYDKVDVTPVLEGVAHASSAVRLGGFGGHAMTEMVAKRFGIGYEEAEAKKVGWDGGDAEGLFGEAISDRISEIGSACINASMVSLVAGEREWRKALMEQVFVCGGGSRVAGFGASVFADVVGKCSSGFRPGLLTVPEYMPMEQVLGCASWYGGHATAGVVMNPAVIQKQCVTRQLYDEHGARALWRRVN